MSLVLDIYGNIFTCACLDLEFMSSKVFPFKWIVVTGLNIFEDLDLSPIFKITGTLEINLYWESMEQRFLNSLGKDIQVIKFVLTCWNIFKRFVLVDS